MSKEILNQLLPLITAIIVAVLTYCVKLVGTAVISYLSKKEKLLEEKVGEAEFTKELTIAKAIWNLVEENFRISPNLKEALGDKANAFDEALHKRLPYLEYSQIRTLRQSIAGEINQGKELLNKDTFKQQVLAIQKQNEQLKSEKQALQDKLNKFSEAVSQVEVPDQNKSNEIKINETNPLNEQMKL